MNIYRLHPNGSVDTTFNAGTGTGAGQPIEAIALQPDGRIIIGGIFNTFNGVPCGHIARLNTDGSLDTTFITGSGFNNTVEKWHFGPMDACWWAVVLQLRGCAREQHHQLNADGSWTAHSTLGPGPTAASIRYYCGSMAVSWWEVAFNAYDGPHAMGWSY
ncbi:MAG: delta-60 repeat domain-containing protein [Flavobacteriales bacterium]|nr:delta-60 repeat domain-containing protein [Flavobacteriales bacterium]